MHIVMEKALAAVQRHQLLCPGDTVFVALSGGADSMTVLSVMLALRETLSLSDVQALHLHHGLRGAAADRDESFVRDVCKKWNVPLTVKHADVRAAAAAAHETCEQAGRRLRYAFFAEQTDGVAGAKVVTAHTQNDQAETVLLHILRGCGLNGLCGIPWSRGNIVRPLLNCTRAEIEDYCQQEQLVFMTDETNADLRFARNRVRLQVLPTMRQVNPAVQQSLVRLSETAAADEDYWRLQVEELLNTQTDKGISARQLLAMHPALRDRALLEAARRAGAGNTEKRHVEQMTAMLPTGGTVNLPQEIIAVCQDGYVRFASLQTKQKPLPEQLLLVVGKSFVFAGNRFMPQVLTAADYKKMKKIHKNLFYSCLSYDMIGDSIYVRTRKDGDKIHPVGRGCGKTLKKLFQEAGVPAEQRDAVPLLCDDDGVLLVTGVAADQRAAVMPQTTRILWIEKQQRKDSLENANA